MTKCAYCGKRLPLLHRVLGTGRFCSKEHAEAHQMEMEALSREAVERLSGFGDAAEAAPALPSLKELMEAAEPVPAECGFVDPGEGLGPMAGVMGLRQVEAAPDWGAIETPIVPSPVVSRMSRWSAGLGGCNEVAGGLEGEPARVEAVLGGAAPESFVTGPLTPGMGRAAEAGPVMAGYEGVELPEAARAAWVVKELAVGAMAAAPAVLMPGAVTEEEVEIEEDEPPMAEVLDLEMPAAAAWRGGLRAAEFAGGMEMVCPDVERAAAACGLAAAELVELEAPECAGWRGEARTIGYAARAEAAELAYPAVRCEATELAPAESGALEIELPEMAAWAGAGRAVECLAEAPVGAIELPRTASGGVELEPRGAEAVEVELPEGVAWAGAERVAGCAAECVAGGPAMPELAVRAMEAAPSGAECVEVEAPGEMAGAWVVRLGELGLEQGLGGLMMPLLRVGRRMEVRPVEVARAGVSGAVRLEGLRVEGEVAGLDREVKEIAPCGAAQVRMAARQVRIPRVTHMPFRPRYAFGPQVGR